MSKLLKLIQNQLIVSCQAPKDSPLFDPAIITAIAGACVKRGVNILRLDTPAHIQAVKAQYPHIVIIGLWKQMDLDSEVYITPRFEDAEAIAEAGAEIIAIDTTQRQRPNGEKVEIIIKKIQQELGKIVMSDIDTEENAIFAQKIGADFVGTTLYGYTNQTKHLSPPGYDLLINLKNKLNIPLICEGGIDNPEMAKKALKLGADAVVVGTAITGIDLKVQAFLKSFE